MLEKFKKNNNNQPAKRRANSPDDLHDSEHPEHLCDAPKKRNNLNSDDLWQQPPDEIKQNVRKIMKQKTTIINLLSGGPTHQWLRAT